MRSDLGDAPGSQDILTKVLLPPGLPGLVPPSTVMHSALAALAALTMVVSTAID